MTRKALGIAPGSPEAKVIDDHIAQRKRSGTVKSIALAVLGIGLGLIAIFATGGLATIALVAGAGMSVYNVATDYKKYMVDSAGHRTDLDPAQALVAEDPSIGWLVVDVVGAGLDVGAAASAVRNMARTLRAIDELSKLGRAAQEGKDAAEIAQTLEDLAVEARAQYRVLRSEGKIAPGAGLTEDAFVKRGVAKAQRRLAGEVTEAETKAKAAKTSEVKTAPAEVAPPAVVVKENKFDCFFGRVKHTEHNLDGSLKTEEQLNKTEEQLKQSLHNAQRSEQNLADLKKLWVEEAHGGRKRLEEIFREGLSKPEKSRIETKYGITITRTVEIPGKGAIDVKYFYPGGDLTKTPEVSTIIPKIFK